MKKFLILPVLFYFLQAGAQSGWKQSLRYNLTVKFNLPEKSLDAQMKLEYTNHSPDTLSYIWFHIWPNAYRNDRTLYSEQLLENGDTRFYFSSKEQKGYLNRLDFRVNGSVASMQDHPEYIDVVKLVLPKPLLPGDSILISTSFHLRIPFDFNGNGYSPHHFELRNWYPEPAVYDKYGWHPMPFLVQGGAYHEAADFVVEIEAPSTYLIATGAITDTISHGATENLYRFSLENANGFAWIADNHYLLKTDSTKTNDGRQINIRYFYSGSNSGIVDKVFDNAKNEMKLLSEWFSPYPSKTLTIVESEPMKDQNFTGMVCIGRKINAWKPALRKGLLGQWFQAILMTDQRSQPWFSKGFISYYNQRLFNPTFNAGYESQLYHNNNLWLRVAEKERTTQPIKTPSPEFSTENDSLIPSNKAGLWLSILRDSVGMNRFDQNMLNYFSYWKFNHPYPEDFQKIMDSVSGKNLQPLFDKLNDNESLFDTSIKRTIKPAFIFSARNSWKYNYIGLAPVPGYNEYDGFMLGAMIHNINLPENKFEFLFSPMYSFGSQRLVGLGRLGYSWYPDKKFSRVSIGINGAHFDTNKATDSSGSLLYENFSKLVPYIRIDFRPASPRSTISKWMDFKTYLIKEINYEQFNVSSQDSLIHPNSTSSSFRYVNQFSFNLADSRILYPYDFRAEFQQSELFYRINLQANYFMNYPDGGGLRVRFFAAKFGVWNENNSSQVVRYEPKLLGVNGDEDYLYEDYFIGRSASYAIEKSSIPNAGLPAQQIMNRDGGLKLRIDDYDYVQGKSADWVSSLNFNTSLPANLFPFPVPIRIFFDVGTYAEAWQNNPPTSHFLYVGGIQLSLFHNLLNIYAPLFYSSDFNQALASTNFGRRISFSIDIQNINYKKVIRKVADHD
ncbi:MAG TPA: M1 family metallopeptidase [Puia sp.]|nr:M1 family metallopeptidase [Puia sp.]